MVILDDDSLLVVGGWQKWADFYPIKGKKPDFDHDCQFVRHIYKFHYLIMISLYDFAPKNN
jgi:hypothetical protein